MAYTFIPMLFIRIILGKILSIPNENFFAATKLTLSVIALWSLVSILYSVVFSKIVTVEDIQKTMKKENMNKFLMDIAFGLSLIIIVVIPIMISVMLFMMSFSGEELPQRKTVAGVIENCDIEKLSSGYFIGITLKNDNSIYRYTRPKEYRDQIKQLCFEHDKVEIKYKASIKKLGGEAILYWIVGIKSLNNNNTIFSEEDYEKWEQQWEKKNNRSGIILLSIFILIFLFALTIVIIRLKKRKKRVAG